DVELLAEPDVGKLPVLEPLDGDFRPVEPVLLCLADAARRQQLLHRHIDIQRLSGLEVLGSLPYPRILVQQRRSRVQGDAQSLQKLVHRALGTDNYPQRRRTLVLGAAWIPIRSGLQWRGVAEGKPEALAIVLEEVVGNPVRQWYRIHINIVWDRGGAERFRL